MMMSWGLAQGQRGIVNIGGGGGGGRDLGDGGDE
jgi:hypothetical protein